MNHKFSSSQTHAIIRVLGIGNFWEAALVSGRRRVAACRQTATYGIV